MNFRHRDDGGHEGQQLGRSGVWGRFRNATDALVDRIEDALEDEKQAIGDFFTRVQLGWAGLGWKSLSYLLDPPLRTHTMTDEPNHPSTTHASR